MTDPPISLRALGSGGVTSWAAPYFHIARTAALGPDDPAVVLASTVVQVLNPRQNKSVDALILFWGDDKRFEDLTAKLAIPGHSLRDHKPFVSDGGVSGWVSVTASGPVIPGGWIEELVSLGNTVHVTRVPLAFQPQPLG